MAFNVSKHTVGGGGGERLFCRNQEAPPSGSRNCGYALEVLGQVHINKHPASFRIFHSYSLTILDAQTDRTALTSQLSHPFSLNSFYVPVLRHHLLQITNTDPLEDLCIMIALFSSSYWALTLQLPAYWSESHPLLKGHWKGNTLPYCLQLYISQCLAHGRHLISIY